MVLKYIKFIKFIKLKLIKYLLRNHFGNLIFVYVFMYKYSFNYIDILTLMLTNFIK